MVALQGRSGAGWTGGELKCRARPRQKAPLWRIAPKFPSGRPARLKSYFLVTLFHQIGSIRKMPPGEVTRTGGESTTKTNLIMPDRKIAQDPTLPQGYSVTFRKRFWKKVDKDGPVSIHMPHLGKCWKWNAAIDRDGRGIIRRGIGTIRETAPRAAWLIFNGPIPDNLFVCHHCDNPSCTNPDHLFLGTAQENVRDMIKKGRILFGESHGSAKLSFSQVMDIIKLKESGMTYKQIAMLFPVSWYNIKRIVRGETWKRANARS